MRTSNFNLQGEQTNRFAMAASVVILIASGAVGANFSITSPVNVTFNHNANIAGFGSCNSMQSGRFYVEYDADGPGGNNPVEWQSVSVTGTMQGMWNGTLDVPTNPGYWHDLGMDVTVQVEVDPPNGAAGSKDNIIKDKP